MSSIIALITALAVAVPSIWAWRRYSAKGKARRQKKKDDKQIIEDVRNGRLDAVANWTTEFLRS